MKKAIILIAILISFEGYSQNNPDAIIGKWLKIPKDDLIIQVFKTGNEYKGKITWAKGNDPKKPADFLILERLEYNSNKNMWMHGKIHDPNSGKTYDAEAKIKSNGTLEVLGYMGMKFLGAKKYFKRVK